MVGRFRNLGPTRTRTKYFQKNGGPTLPEIFDNKAWADQQTFLSPGADQDRNKISGRYAPDPSFPLTRSPCKTSVFPLSLCSVDRIYSFLTDHESRCGNSVFFSDFFRDFWNNLFSNWRKNFWSSTLYSKKNGKRFFILEREKLLTRQILSLNDAVLKSIY